MSCRMIQKRECARDVEMVATEVYLNLGEWYELPHVLQSIRSRSRLERAHTTHTTDARTIEKLYSIGRTVR